MRPRIGLGSDLHRLCPGSGLRLGGQNIPCDLGVEAHSDGDALLHAVTDAILGALGGPDIGELFPDSAAENKDRDSGEFLAEAIRRMHKAGYGLGNLDAIITIQTPKIAPHKDTIRQALAAACACGIDSVNVKAKSGEAVGAVGRGEAIFVQAAVLLLPLQETS